MAAAQGTMRLIGVSGRIYCVNFYANDTTSNLIRFDESKVAVAGSPDYYNVKENCKLIDICFTTDLATPTAVQILYNGTPTGDILDVTAQLVSVVTRPNPQIPFGAGSKLSIMQVA